MQDNKINLEFNTIVSEKDYRTIVYFDIFLKNRLFVISLIIGSIIFVTAFILKSFNIIELNKYYFYYLFAFIILILGAVLIAEKMIKKFIKSDKVSIGAKQNITINEERIDLRIGTDGSFSTLKWNTLYKAFEIKKHFIFYINTQQAIIVSKENISSDDLNKLRYLTKEKLGKSFIKKLF